MLRGHWFYLRRFPGEAVWAAEALDRASEGLAVKIGLHVCGGNAHRKRV
jgi:hypothetical protein